MGADCDEGGECEEGGEAGTEGELSLLLLLVLESALLGLVEQRDEEGERLE